MLYNFQVSYFLEADYLSTNYSISEIGTLALSAAGGTSMALVDNAP